MSFFLPLRTSFTKTGFSVRITAIFLCVFPSGLLQVHYLYILFLKNVFKTKSFLLQIQQMDYLFYFLRSFQNDQLLFNKHFLALTLTLKSSLLLKTEIYQNPSVGRCLNRRSTCGPIQVPFVHDIVVTTPSYEYTCDRHSVLIRWSVLRGCKDPSEELMDILNIRERRLKETEAVNQEVRMISRESNKGHGVNEGWEGPRPRQHSTESM